MTKAPATIEDVARLAEVSIATVSRLRQAAPAGMAVRHETVRRPAALLARALARRAAAGTGLNFKTGRHANPVHLRMEARQRRRA